MQKLKDGAPVVLTGPGKKTKRSVMYATNEEGKRIMMDLCSFCMHYDRETRYEQCRYAGFDHWVDDCQGYLEILPEMKTDRYRELFSDI